MDNLDLGSAMFDETGQIQLKKAITAFSSVANMPVTQLDEDGNILWECLPEKNFCNIFEYCRECRNDCMENIRHAKKTAENINEPYIFLCEAGLTNIMFSRNEPGWGNKMFLVGPIFMGHSKTEVTRKLSEKIFATTNKYVPEFIDFVDKIEIKSPMEVSYIYDVFSNCIFAYNLTTNNIQSVLYAKEQEEQNLQLPEGSRSYYSGGSLRSLTASLRAGNEEAAHTSFRLLYERNYLIETGNINKLKAYLIELFQNISRAVPEGTLTSSYYLEELDELYNSYSFAEIYAHSESLVRRIARANATTAYRGKSQLMKNAFDYINDNCSENISLNQVAEAVHANSSYLSALFKKDTGKTFSQYLTEARLVKSLELLKDSHLSITEIAMMCGFTSQSYFIKKFREHYDQTPKAYRKKVWSNEEEETWKI